MGECIQFTIMDRDLDYFETNRKSWNEKTKVHLASDFYENANFLNGKSTLKAVELDLPGMTVGPFRMRNLNDKKYLAITCSKK